MRGLIASIYCVAFLIGVAGCVENPLGYYTEGWYNEQGEYVTTTDENTLNAPHIVDAWEGIQSGFITTLNSDGTYTFGFASGQLLKTGTWETSGNTITFRPAGEAPQTCPYSMSGDTMTIIMDGESVTLSPS